MKKFIDEPYVDNTETEENYDTSTSTPEGRKNLLMQRIDERDDRGIVDTCKSIRENCDFSGNMFWESYMNCVMKSAERRVRNEK